MSGRPALGYRTPITQSHAVVKMNSSILSGLYLLLYIFMVRMVYNEITVYSGACVEWGGSTHTHICRHMHRDNPPTSSLTKLHGNASRNRPTSTPPSLYTNKHFRREKNVYPQLSKLWRTVSNVPAEVQRVKVCITTVEQRCCTHNEKGCNEQHCKTQPIALLKHRTWCSDQENTRWALSFLLVHCDGSMVYSWICIIVIFCLFIWSQGDKELTIINNYWVQKRSRPKLWPCHVAMVIHHNYWKLECMDHNNIMSLFISFVFSLPGLNAYRDVSSQGDILTWKLPFLIPTSWNPLPETHALKADSFTVWMVAVNSFYMERGTNNMSC